MKTIFFLLLAGFLPSSLALAGRLVGNGGDGVVMKNGVLYSLDLVEAGVAENPYFEKVQIAEDFKGPLKEKFRHIENFPIEQFLSKLSEVRGKSPMLAYLLAAATMQVKWNVVAHELLPIDDEDSSFHFTKGELVQLAARRDLTVYIDKKYFQRLPDSHKVGLILHELVYLLMRVNPVDEWESSANRIERQSSRKAREIVGELFKPNWSEDAISRWLFGEVFEDSIMRDLQMPMADLKFEYRFRNGGFTKLLVSSDKLVLYRNISNGPFEIRGVNWTQGDLESACVEQKQEVFSAPVLKNLILVSPVGEEFILVRHEYCQSLDRDGYCVEQSGLTAVSVPNKGSQDRGFLFSTRDFTSPYAYTSNRAVTPKKIAECAAGLAEKIREVAELPYGK